MSDNKAILHKGCICLDDLISAAESGHSSVHTYDENGKRYAYIMIWENSLPDKRGNTHKIQLASQREFIKKEPRVYFGWAKKSDPFPPEQTTNELLSPEIGAKNKKEDFNEEKW